MLEKDFKKYAQIHSKNSAMRVSHEDLVAIQQIELDRGNYNVGSDQPRLAPRPAGKNRTPPRPAQQQQTKTPRSAEKSRKKTHYTPPSGQQNVSKEFRPQKSHPLDPTIRPRVRNNRWPTFCGLWLQLFPKFVGKFLMTSKSGYQPCYRLPLVATIGYLGL